MPKIKRWHPVSHSFNRDPEVQDLRRQYGDWMAFVWQELCSIADRNEGVVPGTVEQLARSMAPISLWSRIRAAEKKILHAIPFMAERGWLAIRSGGHWLANEGRSKLSRALIDHQSSIDRLSTAVPWDCIFIVNYPKYHRFWEPEKPPPKPSETSEPSLPFKDVLGGSVDKSVDNLRKTGPDVPFLKNSDSENPAADLEVAREEAETARLASINRQLFEQQQARARVVEAFRRLVKQDPRFDPLLSTIAKAQRDGFDNNIIAAALDQIERQGQRIADPCGYLVAVLDRQRQNANGARHEREHKLRKLH